jgi:hypothetical protein
MTDVKAAKKCCDEVAKMIGVPTVSPGQVAKLYEMCLAVKDANSFELLYVLKYMDKISIASGVEGIKPYSISNAYVLIDYFRSNFTQAIIDSLLELYLERKGVSFATHGLKAISCLMVPKVSRDTRIQKQRNLHSMFHLPTKNLWHQGTTFPTTLIEQSLRRRGYSMFEVLLELEMVSHHGIYSFMMRMEQLLNEGRLSSVSAQRIVSKVIVMKDANLIPVLFTSTGTIACHDPYVRLGREVVQVVGANKIRSQIHHISLDGEGNEGYVKVMMKVLEDYEDQMKQLVELLTDFDGADLPSCLAELSIDYLK